MFRRSHATSLSSVVSIIPSLRLLACAAEGLFHGREAHAEGAVVHEEAGSV